MSEDREVEYLKRKQLQKIRKRLLIEKVTEASQQKVKERKDPHEILQSFFTDSAWKVWRVAEQQHPKGTEEVAKALITLTNSGKLRGKVTDQQILWLFKQIGLPIRFETKIRIFEGGEFKTIAEKLRGS